MNTLNIMIWNDATVKGNDVECLVSIDMQNVAMLVTAELQKITGKNYAHWEVKGLTDEHFIVDGVKSVTISEDEIIANQALITKQAELIKMLREAVILARPYLFIYSVEDSKAEAALEATKDSV